MEPKRDRFCGAKKVSLVPPLIYSSPNLPNLELSVFLFQLCGLHSVLNTLLMITFVGPYRAAVLNFFYNLCGLARKGGFMPTTVSAAHNLAVPRAGNPRRKPFQSVYSGGDDPSLSKASRRDAKEGSLGGRMRSAPAKGSSNGTTGQLAITVIN